MAERRPARLRWNPLQCDGVGICAHLATELITMDSWGFPILVADIVDAATRRQARAAAAACPRRALFVDDIEPSG